LDYHSKAFEEKQQNIQSLDVFTDYLYKKYTICGGDMLECKKQKLEVRL
jgi:hypothetical protein